MGRHQPKPKSTGTPDAASSAARGASASGVASELSEVEMLEKGAKEKEKRARLDLDQGARVRSGCSGRVIYGTLYMAPGLMFTLRK